MAKHYVAAWAEDFEDLYEFSSEKEANGFAQGWSSGAGNYGAGKCVTYVLPRELADLEHESNADDLVEVKEAFARKNLPMPVAAKTEA